MPILYFIILCFATWRLTKMLVYEKGPYDILVKLRNSVVNKTWSPLWCYDCTSMWVAFFLSLLLHLSFEIFILYWFAVSGISIFMMDLFNEIEEV